MKIRMISQAFTPFGAFERGQELQSGGKFTEEFLVHLVEAAGAAEYIEAKMEKPVEENKMVKKPVPENKAITNASIPTKKKRGRPPKRS